VGRASFSPPAFRADNLHPWDTSPRPGPLRGFLDAPITRGLQNVRQLPSVREALVGTSDGGYLWPFFFFFGAGDGEMLQLNVAVPSCPSGLQLDATTEPQVFSMSNCCAHSYPPSRPANS